MSRHLAWNELNTGLVAFVSIAGVAIAVLVFGRVGTLHGKTFRLYVTSDAARGLIRGSEVWLDGHRVGAVRSIDFRPPGTAPRDRLVMALDVLADARTHIRRDSRVEVRAGTSLIGDQVVSIGSGSPGEPAVADGDTVAATPQPDVEAMTSGAALATREFPAIIENVKLLTAQLQGTRSTIGALGAGGADTAMRRIGDGTTRLIERLSSPRGTLGMARGSSAAVRARTERALAAADSIRTLVASNRTSLGRFRRDSTLAREVAHIRDELATVRKLADSPDGTIGRLRTDSAITRAVHRDVAALDSLLADIKKHPLRYITF